MSVPSAIAFAPPPKRPRRRGARLILAACLMVAALGASALAALALWAKSDARITRVVNAQLQTLAPGLVHIGRVHWVMPLGLVVQDVSLRPNASDQPLLRVHHLQLRVRLRPLLRAQLVLGPSRVDGVEIWADGPLAGPKAGLGVADAPAQADAAAAPGLGGGIGHPLQQILARLPAARIEDLQVRHVRFTQHVADTALVVEDASLHLTAKADGAGSVTMTLRSAVGQGTWATPAGLWHLDTLALSLTSARVSAQAHAPGGISWAMDDLSLTGPGVDIVVDGHGDVDAGDAWTAQLAVVTGVTVGHPMLQAWLPSRWRLALRAQGGMQGLLTVAAAGNLSASPQLDSGTLTLRLGGPELAFADIGVGPLALDAHIAQGDALTFALAGSLDGAPVACEGATTLTPRGVGAHRISLRTDALPLKSLARKLAPVALEMPSLAAPWRQLQAQAAYLPQWLTFRLIGQGAALWPEQRTTLATEVQAAGITAVHVPASALPVTATASAELSPEGLALERATVTLGQHAADLFVHGAYPWAKNLPVRLRVSGHAPKIATLLAEADVPLRAQGVHVACAMTGSSTHLHGDGEILVRHLTRVQAPPSGARAGTPDQVTELGDLRVPLHFDGGTLMTQGVTLVGRLGKAGMTGFVRLLTRSGKTLPKHAMQMHFELRASDWRVAELLGASPQAGVATPETQVEAPLGAAHALVGGTLGAPLMVADVSSHNAGGTAAAHLRADQDGATLERLVYSPDGGGQLWATGAVRLAEGGVNLQVGGHLPCQDAPMTAVVTGHVAGNLHHDVHLEVSAHTPRSNVCAEGTAHLHEAEIDLRVAGDGALQELAMWHPVLAEQEPTGHLSARLRLKGPWTSPEGTGTLAASGLARAGRPVAGGRIDATLRTPDAGHYAVALRAPEALDVDVDLFAGPTGPWRVAADISRFSVAALYPPLAVQGGDLTGDAKLDLRLSRRTFRPFGTLRIGHLVASSRGEQMALQAPTQVHVDGPNFGIGRTTLVGPPGKLTLEGHMGALVRASLSTQLSLAFLTPFIPDLTYARGEMAMHMQARGSRADPQVDADLQITQAAVLRPRGVPMEVRLGTGTVTLTNSALVVDHVRGGIEGGAFALDGSIALRRFMPTAFDLTLIGQGIPVRHDDLLLESNITLACSGPGTSPKVRGEVDIVSGRYLRRLELHDFAFVVREPSVETPVAQRMPWLRQVQLDVHATSHDGVDVQMDAGVFAVKASLETDLHVGGNALEPQLSGKVQAREGTLSFPRGDLHLMQAAVDFEPSRRSDKDPLGAEILVRAEGEVQPSSAMGAEAYVITMSVDGPPQDLNLDLTSASSGTRLSRLQVLSLLSTGHIDLTDPTSSGDDLVKLDTAQALAGSASALVTAPMSRFAQKKIEQAFNLRLDLSAEMSGSNLKVMAAKNVSRRIRLEGAFTQGITAAQSNIATRAQMSLTDRLRLESNVAADLTGTSASATQDGTMQSNVGLKYRLSGP